MTLKPFRLDEMIRQADRLATDLREQTPRFNEQFQALAPAELKSASTVYLIGDGDSYHAACAAELAFETIADIPCRPVSALSFLTYQADQMRAGSDDVPLVVAISASGTTEMVISAVKRANTLGAVTVALTGRPDSPITRAARRALVLELPDLERSPGIRTYQASLLGLTLLAIRLAEVRGQPASVTGAVRAELARLANIVEATADAVRERCREAAAATAGAPTTAIVGCGPSHGTALYVAAKLVEAAGVPAIGEDLEEWWHVERYAYPVDMPLVVIAPPGRSHWRACKLAAAANQLGRRVITVAGEEDVELTRHAHLVLPVRGQVREELSPFAYHVFAGYLAAEVATLLGRAPFQT